MKKIKKKEDIPQLLSDEEEFDFWSNHDLSEMLSNNRLKGEKEELSRSLAAKIKSGERKIRFQNISIRLDPYQIQAIKKIASKKSLQYQSLIRLWIVEGIKHELLESVMKKN